jgi:hypothetical protein
VRSRLIALMLGFCAAAAFSSVAAAGPINLTISDSLDGVIANQDTVAGTNSFIGSSAHFATVSAIATPSSGVDLGTVTLDLTVAGPGLHVLTILATQTGLNEAVTGSSTTFTYNGLEGSPGPNTDTMFVNGSSIESHTFPAAMGVADEGPLLNGAETILSDAEEFQIAFNGAAGIQEFEGTIEFIATPVREAAGWTVLLVGLVAMAVLKIRQSRRNPFPERSFGRMDPNSYRTT